MKNVERAYCLVKDSEDGRLKDGYAKKDLFKVWWVLYRNSELRDSLVLQVHQKRAELVELVLYCVATLLAGQRA